MAKTVLRSAMTPVLGVIMRVVCVTLDVSLAGWATSAIVLFLPVIKLIIIITRYMILTSSELFIKKGQKKNPNNSIFQKIRLSTT